MQEPKFTFVNIVDGKEKLEEVKLENWIWAVTYKDGNELHQFDNQRTFHRLAEIDQSKVAVWTLYQPKGKGDGHITFVLPLDKEVALIHKYRNYVFNSGQKNEKKVRIYIFGYKVKGQVPHYNFIMPDNRIVQSFGDQNPKLSSDAIK